MQQSPNIGTPARAVPKLPTGIQGLDETFEENGEELASDVASLGFGAKRIVLDTIESLFSGLGNANILRAALRRLFRWLKDKGSHAAWHIHTTCVNSPSRTTACD